MSNDLESSAAEYPFASVPPAPTGGLVVVYHEGASELAAERALQDAGGGLKIMNRRELGASPELSVAQAAQADAVIFPRFGAAVINPGDPERVASIRNQLMASDSVVEVRPEFWMFAIQSAGAGFADDAASTWGVEALGAHASRYTGRGVEIAVLDTGFDLNHPDYRGRNVKSFSCVPGQSVQDGQGHGTHCIGTAAGRTAGNGVRYGVAPDADIHAIKVLSNEGSGREAWILEGMERAIGAGSAVISMSLGRATSVGEAHSVEYERLGRAALNAGCLIIAAAGNESARRYNHVAPVGAPANSPSIMAVAAVDSALRITDFSCGGVNAGGGAIDLAGPGADVFSSVPMPLRYKRLNGTSMATPHIAGLAALLAESDPSLRGTALWNALIASCRSIGLSQKDGGAGFPKAP